MVKDMQSDYLEHMQKGGQKKVHEYISRYYKNGKWFYRYAKDKVKEAGKKVEDVAYDAKWTAEENAEKAKQLVKDKSGLTAKENMYEAQRKHRSASNVRNDSYFKNAKTPGEKSWNQIVDQDVKNKRDTAHAAKQVYDKTPLGKAESAVEKGRKKIEELLRPKEKITVTSNLMPASTKKTVKKK